MPRPVPVLAQLPCAPHGGPDGSAAALLDFSVNSNPFGPPPELLARLRELDVSSYPDPTYREARSQAAAYHRVTSEHIVLGSAAELIYRLAACYLSPQSRVLIAAPSFGEYARSSLLHGAQVQVCRVYSKASQPDAAALLDALAQLQPTLVWLCQPNNPTGHVWSTEALASLAQACEVTGALLVIDAAYLELSDAPALLPEGAVRLFALTKTFAIAGLRAGYAVAPPDVVAVLRAAAPPWSVSTPAQAAVSWCRSPAGTAFVARTAPELLQLSHGLQTDLLARGFSIWRSRSSFFLLEARDSRSLSARARAAGFRLRDTSSLGLPGHVRLAAQDRTANERLSAWLTHAC